ncbi:MAG TPA: DNA sulfur modification protein DndB [Halomicronema sp.]
MFEEKRYLTEPNQPLDEVLGPYYAKYHREKCYPGLILHQGKRKMVQINVPAGDLPTLLLAKPALDNDPDSGKNRPEAPGHAEEITDYLLKRISKGKAWILGTLTANVAPDKIEIIDLGRGICFVVIPRSVKFDITDGQHRKFAIDKLIQSADGELIADNDFPLTLVLEADFQQCQIDFKDMAQTKPLDKSLLSSYEFEGSSGIAKALIQQVPIFHAKTDKVGKNPNTKKKLIYTMNYITRFVSCVFADNPNDNLEDCDVEELAQPLVSCLNQFFSECKHTRFISETSVDDLTIDQIFEFKENCILGRSVGLEILGRLLHCIFDPDSNEFFHQQVSQIAKIDWTRSSELWKENVIVSNLTAKNSGKSYKILANAIAIKMAVNKVKEHLGWV